MHAFTGNNIIVHTVITKNTSMFVGNCLSYIP